MTKQPELWTFVRLTDDDDAVEVARVPSTQGGGVEATTLAMGIPAGDIDPKAARAATLSRTLTIIRDVLLRGPVTMAALRQHVADNHKWMLETTVSARIRDLRNLHGYDVRWDGTHYWIEP